MLSLEEQEKKAKFNALFYSSMSFRVFYVYKLKLPSEHRLSIYASKQHPDFIVLEEEVEEGELLSVYHNCIEYPPERLHLLQAMIKALPPTTVNELPEEILEIVKECAE